MLGPLICLCLPFGFRRFSPEVGRRSFDHETLGDFVIRRIGGIWTNVTMILLLNIWPEYVHNWRLMTTPTETRGTGLGTLARRILKSKDGNVVGVVLFGLFEYRLVGLGVAFVVSAFGHRIQDVQKRSRRGR